MKTAPWNRKHSRSTVLGNSKTLDLVLSFQRWKDGGPDGQPVEDGLEVDAQAFLLDLFGDLRDRLLGG